MPRTRVWAVKAGEAKALAAAGLSAEAIALRVQVHRSTLFRWIKAGKLPGRGPTPHGPAPDPVSSRVPASVDTTWGTAVRQAYVLDASEEQLVQLGEVALTLAKEATAEVSVRFAAMSRFQAIVKQLKLPALPLVDTVPCPPAREQPAPCLPRTDPRKLLQ